MKTATDLISAAMSTWDAMSRWPTSTWAMPQAPRNTKGHKTGKARKRRRKAVQASRRANR